MRGWVRERRPWPASATASAAATADRIVLEPVSRLPVPDATTAGLLVHKTGGTGGFGARVGFVPEASTGLVHLANANHPTTSPVELGVRLLAAGISEASGASSAAR